MDIKKLLASRSITLQNFTGGRECRVSFDGDAHGERWLLCACYLTFAQWLMPSGCWGPRVTTQSRICLSQPQSLTCHPDSHYCLKLFSYLQMHYLSHCFCENVRHTGQVSAVCRSCLTPSGVSHTAHSNSTRWTGRWLNHQLSGVGWFQASGQVLVDG